MQQESYISGVIGIDEVGRGPLAGPVTVCAIYLSCPKSVEKLIFPNTIRDSKKLSINKRNNIYQTINKNRKNNNHSIIYICESRSAAFIDKYGINVAVHACIVSCLKKLKKSGVFTEKIQINLDGGLLVKDTSLLQESFVKGDERFVEIALASIVAKVRRDKYMMRASKQYPQYFFDKNMGYGTLAHRKAIVKYGISKIHRLSYLSNILSIN